jgi:EpsI family protein
VIGMDVQGIMGPLKKFPGMKAGRAFVATSVFALVAGAAWQLMPAHVPDPVTRLPLGVFPLQVEGWKGQASILDSNIERVLGADDYLLADYRKGNEDVNLLMTFYDSQTQGSGIHSPEICLPGGGWEVSRWQQKLVSIDGGDHTLVLQVNRAVIQRGLERQLVYFWFEQRGRRLTNDFEAKFASMWDTITSGRSDGGLVRVVTPIGQAEDDEQADARLQSFLQNVVPQLPEYFPDLHAGQDV